MICAVCLADWSSAELKGCGGGGVLTCVRLQVVGELVWSAVATVELRH